MNGDDKDWLAVSTVRTGGQAVNSARTTLPCLTIVAHPDITRVGDRAALRGLLIGQPVLVSRAQPTFGKPGGAPTAPLADPHVSREPFELAPDGAGAVRIRANSALVKINGSAASDADNARAFSAFELERGILLELPGKVLLLLHQHTNRAPSQVAGLLGQSDEIEDTRLELLRVADLGTPVLIRGETGTGKEQAAQAIHMASQRRDGQYVAVNMATVPESVALSTLFGHTKGAFTGAHQRHHGLFERASGGTLLLDEIGETPQNVQPMLLRAVETGRILPLGDEREREVDVRFIAATDSDLERELAGRSFSAALLHRLAGYEIYMPPLRARGEDIAILLFHFLQRELVTVGETQRLGELSSLLVASGLLRRLLIHPLSGNVRQLRNVARHLVISNRGQAYASITQAVERQLKEHAVPDAAPLLRAQSLGIASEVGAAPGESSRPAEISDTQLVEALRTHGWSPNRTAVSLGIPTGTLHDLMRRSNKVRRAADLSDDELRAALRASDGDLSAAADTLCVSERALRIAVRQRGLADSD